MSRFSLALLGEKIGHSKSKEMYEKILNQEIDYSLIDVNTENIPSLEKIFSSVQGLSITSPHKKFFLNDVNMDSNISSLNAINCIKKSEGSFFGTNTDYLALKEIIPKLITDNKIDMAIILGSGSMATITQKIFSDLDIAYQSKSRKADGDISKIDLTNLGESLLVINSCSREFVFEGKLDRKTLFFDYNYSFSPHSYLQSQCQYLDGLNLLFKQAQVATAFWELDR